MLPPPIFGEVPGFPVESKFASRRELADAGLHRHLQAGIVGSASRGGAESIVLSGGYKDDEDLGHAIIYTGHGGRDQNSGRQVADQELKLGNLALIASADHGNPVRVIRGANHPSPHSPSSGYEYAGLYFVERYWPQVGKDGFLVYRYFLRRDTYFSEQEEPGESPLLKAADRKLVTTQRIIRSTATANRVKAIYDDRCQVCLTRISLPAGGYSEGAHIQPLGKPHNGPDVEPNILCLCPNHHVMLDRGVIAISDDLHLIGIDGSLEISKRHRPASEFISYHRTTCWFGAGRAGNS